MVKLKSLVLIASVLIIMLGCAPHKLKFNHIMALSWAHLQLDEVSYSVNARPQVVLVTIDSYFNDIGWTRVSSYEMNDTVIVATREAWNLHREASIAQLPYLLADDWAGFNAANARIKRTQQYKDWEAVPPFTLEPSVGSTSFCQEMSGPEINAKVYDTNKKFRDVIAVCVSGAGENSTISVGTKIQFFTAGKFQEATGTIGILWVPLLDGSRVSKSIKLLKTTLSGSL